jgi:hypothetical protein
MNFPRHLSVFALLAVWSSASAGIDSGGGLSSGGAVNNHCSIGGFFLTHTGNQGIPLPGAEPPPYSRNSSGLMEVIYLLTRSSAMDHDSSADADHDGSSNLMEYLAGTNPNSASSVFRPQGVYVNGVFRMPEPTVSGRAYHIWASRDLKNWTLHRTMAGNGSVRIFEFDETTITSGPLYSSRHPSTCFFRVSISMPDMDSETDSDRDGNSNLMEYLAGTDPNNAASVFRPQGSLTNGVFRMTIPTISDRIYHVWVSRDLQNWTLHRSLSGNDAPLLYEFDETSITSGPLYSNRHPSTYFFRIQIQIP